MVMAESPTPYRRIRPNWKPITPEAYDPGKHPLAYSGQSILLYQEDHIHRVSWVEKEQKWIGPYGLRFPWLLGYWCALPEAPAGSDVLAASLDIQKNGLRDRAVVLAESIGWVQAHYREDKKDWMDVLWHSFKGPDRTGWTIDLPERGLPDTVQVLGTVNPLWQ